MSNIHTEIEKILKDYRQVLNQQMGLILTNRHRLDIETADTILIDEPIKAIEALLLDAQAEGYKRGYIAGGIDEFNKGQNNGNTK